jgi:uncharacterized cupredoxin-like copper-binding protein
VLALVAGLSAGHKTGLAVVAGVFIVFALSAAMLIPSRWPDFPTGAGLRPFLAATAALFVGMMLAVYFLARESESEAKEPPSAAGASKVAVSEVDFKIKLNAAGVKAGEYTFDVKNDGKSVHNLTIEGQGLDRATADLQPGESGDLTVDLKPGKYELYCSIDGHKKLGMDAKLTVS